MTETAPTGSPPAPPTGASSLQRDVVSAYAATAAKIVSWVIVLGLIYRLVNVAEFAMLALVRGTIGILNYTTLGLSPAMVRMLAEARIARPQSVGDGTVLSYFSAAPERGVQSLYSNGLMIALATGALGAMLALAYAAAFGQFYRMPYRLEDEMFWPVLWIGLGTVLRLMSDAPGALLQANGLIAKDNWRLVEAEAAWIVLSVFAIFGWADNVNLGDDLEQVSFCFAISGLILFLRRARYAQKLTGLLLPSWRLVDTATIKRLLAFGSLVLFAQLADYLYAPTDYILINLLLGWERVADYTPAMTIDSGLLLLVTGLSNVILPRTAIAHTSGEIERVRRYYLWGTVFSAFLLLVAAAVVWIASPLIFRLWLGDPMRATQAILPLVLIHTVVGGSSAVGRSSLLGMGRVRAFTISVLLAGVMNVILSYIFVRHLDLGLKGIVLGTIVVVVARAGVWMPWYVLRTLRREARV